MSDAKKCISLGPIDPDPDVCVFRHIALLHVPKACRGPLRHLGNLLFDWSMETFGIADEEPDTEAITARRMEAIGEDLATAGHQLRALGEEAGTSEMGRVELELCAQAARLGPSVLALAREVGRVAREQAVPAVRAQNLVEAAGLRAGRVSEAASSPIRPTSGVGAQVTGITGVSKAWKFVPESSQYLDERSGTVFLSSQYPYETSRAIFLSSSYPDELGKIVPDLSSYPDEPVEIRPKPSSYPDEPSQIVPESLSYLARAYERAYEAYEAYDM